MTDRRALLAVILIGVILRVFHIATSLGSLDSLMWMQHVILTERFGLLEAYLHDPHLNHPPLGLAIARGMSDAGALFGLQFQDAFRLLQTLADVVTTLALARLAGPYAASVFALSPAVIFISGFHCQSDPLMTMFLVLAVVATVEKRPVAAGIAIGCAAGIKIIALVALPLLLLRFRGRRDIAAFCGLAALIGALMFVPAIAATGTVVLRNVFAYTGIRASWGLNYFLHDAMRTTPFLRPLPTYALLAALAVLWVAELRRRSEDPMRVARVVGTALLLVLVLAPGFAVQYLFWPLPFLALVLRRYEALALHAIVSAFLFRMYTTWSDGWPWWFGNHGSGTREVYWAVATWIALAIALVLAITRLRRREETSTRSLYGRERP